MPTGSCTDAGSGGKKRNSLSLQQKRRTKPKRPTFFPAFRATVRLESADSKKTQQARILGLLVKASGGWVSLSQILDLRISQFGARIYELRKLGFRIVNRTERVEGQTRSWFRLETNPQQLQLLALQVKPPEYPD